MPLKHQKARSALSAVHALSVTRIHTHIPPECTTSLPYVASFITSTRILLHPTLFKLHPPRRVGISKVEEKREKFSLRQLEKVVSSTGENFSYISDLFSRQVFSGENFTLGFIQRRK